MKKLSQSNPFRKGFQVQFTPPKTLGPPSFHKSKIPQKYAYCYNELDKVETSPKPRGMQVSVARGGPEIPPRSALLQGYIRCDTWGVDDSAPHGIRSCRLFRHTSDSIKS